MHQTSKKNKIIFYLINIFIILIVFGLTLYKIIDENGIETFKYIKNISLLSLILLIVVFFFNYYIEGLIISISIREYKKDFDAIQGLKVHSVGALFSSITPLKVGYLPSIAYAYSKFDVQGESVIKSMAKTSYTYQVFSLIISLVAFIVCSNKEMIVHLKELDLNLKYVALVGLMYNSALMIGYLILALSPQVHNLVIRTWSWFLFKIKKIDRREEYIDNKKYTMHIIRQSIIHYYKDVKQFMKLFLLYVFKACFYSALPYIVFLLISKQSFEIDTWFYALILRELITYITNVIPIPGGSGAVEIVFVAAYSLIFYPHDLLNSTMIVWRLFSYFINIVVGFLIFSIMVSANKKSKKNLTQ